MHTVLAVIRLEGSVVSHHHYAPECDHSPREEGVISQPFPNHPPHSWATRPPSQQLAGESTHSLWNHLMFTPHPFLYWLLRQEELLFLLNNQLLPVHYFKCFLSFFVIFLLSSKHPWQINACRGEKGKQVIRIMIVTGDLCECGRLRNPHYWLCKLPVQGCVPVRQ